MRVVHLINNLPVGGAERFLVDLAAAQARSGWEPIVVALAEPAPLAAALAQRGIAVRRLGRRRLNDPRALVDCWRALRALRPAVVHTHLFYADVFGRIAARLARVPVVVTTLHSTERETLRRRRLWGMRVTARLADRVVAVSAPVRDAAAARLGLPPSAIAVIPNGIDLGAIAAAAPLPRPALGLPPDAIVVGCVGRLVESKGFDAVLAAVARVGAPALHVVVAGDGPQRVHLEALADRLGLASRVRFLGVRDDVPGLLRSLDIFALPSRFEGHSIALLEALAAGCACIVGDVPELTQVAGAAALAVRPGDPIAVAAALEALLDPARRRALAAAAAAAAAPFDIATVAARYARVYRDALAARGAL
jgi:glycosyltransferase involved in cell wall biosynthesis